MISPDGRWIAFHSDESGEFEVYVTTFPVAGRKWQISTANGVYPEWRADGGEIVYTDFAGDLVAVQVDGGGETFDVGASETLFPIETPEAGRAPLLGLRRCRAFSRDPGCDPAGRHPAQSGGQLADPDRGPPVIGSTLAHFRITDKLGADRDAP